MNLLSQYITAFRATASKLPIPSPDIQAKIVIQTLRLGTFSLTRTRVRLLAFWIGIGRRVLLRRLRGRCLLGYRIKMHVAPMIWDGRAQIIFRTTLVQQNYRSYSWARSERWYRNFVDAVRRSKLIHELLIFARLWLHSTEPFERANEFLKSMGVELVYRPNLVKWLYLFTFGMCYHILSPPHT